MQYLRRDKKDEEDGKMKFINVYTFSAEILKKICYDPTLLLVLGAQSNPFQNLDKSAVLQEVSRKYCKLIFLVFLPFLFSLY